MGDGHDRLHDITQHEIVAMRTEFNLADAHTRQSQSPSQKEIVERLPELWLESERDRQHVFEDRFIEAFFRSQRQMAALTTPTLLTYSSSIAMVIVANYLAKKQLSCTLIEPCFDNIPDILRNLNVAPLDVLDETLLHDSKGLGARLRAEVSTEALFLVEPNNPTGFTLEGTSKNRKLRMKRYEELISFAKERDVLLVFDFCFSAFLLEAAEGASFDVYAELERSGVSYLIIEDSGKIWPLQDAKVALLKASKDVYPDVFDIHSSYQLNVSPFILNLVTQYVLDSEADGFRSVLSLLRDNRATLRQSLSGLPIELLEPQANVSVAWLRIINEPVSATHVQQTLRENGVYVLPGTYFFWADHSKGEGYLRIALARDRDYFEAAVQRLQSSLSKCFKILGIEEADVGGHFA